MSSLSMESLFGVSSRSLGLSSKRKSSKAPNYSHQTLTIRPSPTDDKSFIIDRANPNGSLHPLFCFVKSKKGFQIYRIGAGNAPVPQTFIGDSTYSSMSGHTTFNLHGEPIKMKTPDSSSGHKFTNSMGKFKWKSDSITKQALALSDVSGMTLARFQVGQRLDILVPCDDLFLDLVVVSALAAAKMKKKDGEAAEAVGEVLSAVLGG